MLAELVASGEVRREEIIVVSKIGYIQGQNLKLAEAKEQSGHPYPERGEVRGRHLALHPSGILGGPADSVLRSSGTCDARYLPAA